MRITLSLLLLFALVSSTALAQNPGQRGQGRLPNDVTLTVVKKGREPAKITVVQGDKTWEVTEGNLGEELPAPVAAYLNRMFARPQQQGGPQTQTLELKQVFQKEKTDELPFTVTIFIQADSANEKNEAWAKKAGELVVEWYPKLNEMLKTDDFTPMDTIRIIFRKMDGVAYAAGGTINISLDWIERQPNDFGMVVHELSHISQSYRNGNPMWVTEGISDYIRHAKYEPEVPMPRINPDRAKYTDAYKTTAGFFMWIEKNYKDANLLATLNKAMRSGTYNDEVFKTMTGKTLDELWKDYTDTFR